MLSLKRFIGMGQQAVVTVSGEAAASSSSGVAASASIIFRADGTVDKVEDGVTTQVDLTDWIVPHNAASGAYQIRYTAFSGSALLNPPAAEDEWIDLSEDRQYTLFRLGNNVGSSGCNFTIEIRKGTGATLDSGAYSLTATVT